MTTHPLGKRVPGPDPAPGDLLDVKQTAKLLNVSSRMVYRLADAGKMPRPIKLGSLVRWRASEIRAWINDGCPSCLGSDRCSGKGGAQ